MKIHFFILVLLVCIFAPTASAEIIYVDVSASGANDGTSWEDAYTAIQTAIDNSADFDEIRVAEGIYDENIDLGGKAILLTGTDPDDPNVVAATVIDGGGAGSVITCTSGETNDTIIAGFWIQNGDAGTGNGGGVNCHNASPVIKNCVFSGNTANAWGGGIFCWSGEPQILNCTFIGNSISTWGGGISCYQSNPTVKNCVFSSNSAVSNGGAIGCYQSGLTVINCSFSGNSARLGGAIHCHDNSELVLVNSILWGDSATTSGSEIYVSGSSSTVSYSDIEGGWTGDGTNNISDDPLFIDVDGADDTAGTADDNLYLNGYSVCINAGDPEGDYTGQSDRSGFNRVLYLRVDIGAYEIFPVGGDLNEDEQVDTADFMMFAESWLIEVDLTDFALLAGQWLYGVE